MKFRWDNKYLHWGVTGFCVIAASLLFCFGIFRMHILLRGIRTVIDILMPIIFGAVIAYLLNPIVNFMEKSLIYPFLKARKLEISRKMRRFIRYIVVLLALLIFGLIIYALVMMILPELIKSIVSITNSFPRYIQNCEKWITALLEDRPDLNETIGIMFSRYSQKIEQYLTQDLLPNLRQTVLHVSAGVFGALVFLKNFLIGAIVSVYILADKEGFLGKIKMVLYAVFSTKHANNILDTMRFTHKTFGGFISGKILDSAIIGVLCYIVTSIIGTPYAILVSVVVGITNVIPLFGPYLGAVPCALLVLLVDPLQCLYFIIAILVLQQFDGNILGPKILGDSTGLSSFMVIVAILVGGGLFGIAGMLVGVPICAVIYALIFRAVEHKLAEKNLPTKPEIFRHVDYIDIDTGKVCTLEVPMKEEDS